MPPEHRDQLPGTKQVKDSGGYAGAPREGSAYHLWGCVLTSKFYYLSGLTRPTGHEITAVGKIVGYTHRFLETGAMVHYAGPQGKAPTLVMSRENCGQEPLLRLLQEGPGEAG